MTSPESFFGTGGAPSATFPNPGDSIEGTIVDQVVVQSRDYDSKHPLWWVPGQKMPVPAPTQPHPEARPKEQLNVTLQTSLRDPKIDDDDGERRVYFDNKRITAAANRALREVKVRSFAAGGWLRVTFTQWDPQSQNPKNPARDWEVEYRVPSGDTAAAGFLAGEPQPAASSPAPANRPGVTVRATGEVIPLPDGMTVEVWNGLPDTTQAGLARMASAA